MYYSTRLKTLRMTAGFIIKFKIFMDIPFLGDFECKKKMLDLAY